MQTQFFVSHQEQQYGPHSVAEIADKVTEGAFELTDFIYDENQKDWVMIVQFSPVMTYLESKKPKARPADTVVELPKNGNQKEKITLNLVKSNEPPSPREWYILKGENKFGPFAYSELVKMLQEKVCFEFDYVWHSEMQGWKRIAELKDFAPQAIKKLKESGMPEISEVFFRRRYRRVTWGGSILVHDNRKVWKGHGIEISAGGAGLYMENALLVPGQTLYVHFKPGDGVPPFNSVCEVVSKEFVGDASGAHAPIRYGVKFVNIASSTQKELEEWTEKKPGAA